LGEAAPLPGLSHETPEDVEKDLGRVGTDFVNFSLSQLPSFQEIQSVVKSLNLLFVMFAVEVALA